jgi:hypothetical protein
LKAKVTFRPFTPLKTKEMQKISPLLTQKLTRIKKDPPAEKATLAELVRSDFEVLENLIKTSSRFFEIV